MKKIANLLLIAATVLLVNCKNSGPVDTVDNGPEEEGATLKDPVGWKTTELDTGLTWYNYTNLYKPFNARQIVNVLELDLNDPGYRIEVVFESPLNILSNVVKKHGAVAGINGTYEPDASFVKSGGTIYSQVTIEPGHLRYWKHEGAMFYDGASQVSIAYGTNASYLASTVPNIISGSPMLIDNNAPVGEYFIGDVTGIDITKLNGEDYRRHQGVRHPRTVVALTKTNRLLLITIDGRWSQAVGMTAKEVTQFLRAYFKPQYALNIDGGGSTTMYIEDSKTGVVNYPCDNGSFTHDGERNVSSFILIKKTSGESAFAGGNFVN